MGLFKGLILLLLLLLLVYDANISFCLSCELLDIQARLTDVLGLHRTNSRVSIDSINSYAGSINTKKAYKRFCKGLFEIGVTADMIRQKEEEIRNIFKSQATSGQIGDSSQLGGSSQRGGSSQIGDSTTTDQSQLLPVSDFPSVENLSTFLNRNILTENRSSRGLAGLYHQ